MTQPQEKTTSGQILMTIVGSLVAMLIGVVLLVQLIQSAYTKPVPSDEKAIAERIKPVGSVQIAGAETKTAEAPAPASGAVVAKIDKNGEEIYKVICANCHNTGVLSAPKFGNKDDWAPRIAQGYDTLVKNAITGIRNMPARGGASGLSDVEMQRAVVYMANSAGAKFSAQK
jgi:cytochrome c5